MNWKRAFFDILIVLIPVELHAATVTFRATLKGDAWQCTPTSKPDQTAGLTIQVLIDGAPADPVQVVLKATYGDADSSKSGDLSRSPASKSLWMLTIADAAPKPGSDVTVKGTIAGRSIDCKGEVPAAPPGATAAPAAAAAPGGVDAQSQTSNDEPARRARYKAIDFDAMEWLGSRRGIDAVHELMRAFQQDHPSVTLADFVLLKHLPSGAPAFPFPASVSERQTIQIAAVVDKRTMGSIEVSLTNCTRPRRERMKGEFGALAAKPESSVRLRPDFALLPIGTLVQCGPEAMGYTVTVVPEPPAEALDPASVSLEVRPVYHLGATAVFGYDTVKRSTFAVRSGVVAQQTDSIGPTLLVGATWYPFGVDYGQMRWYNYVFNPLVVVDLASPKDNFVIGNAVTVTGGISVAVGWSFHHLDQLDGIAVGDPLTGNGAITTRKVWSKSGQGLYVGLAVDTNVLKALNKISGSGAATNGTAAGGGGTAKPDK